MGVRFNDRLWMITGAALVAVLVAATWFLAVNPQRVEAADLEIRTADAQAQADDLRNRITKLTADKADLPALTKALQAKQAALPADSGVPAFLRQLQATGTKVGVDISGIAVGDPAQEKTTAGVWAISIQLTAEGTEAQLGEYLRQLQSADQKRAVLVQIAGLSTTGDTPTLNLTVKAFVAPPVGGGTPAITTN
jgi:type IV pilus assembly protein PilO